MAPGACSCLILGSMRTATLHELERVLKALANVNRLKLLETLQVPQGYADINLQPSRGDEWGSDERAISRQALRKHLHELMEIGVVVELPSGESGTRRYTVNHARLFGVVEQMRQIATVRGGAPSGGQTVDLEVGRPGGGVDGPHLVLVRGVQEGRCYSLVTQNREPEWSIGRGRGADVSLDYDPYASTSHARVVLKERQFFLVDLPSNRNGTFLNWNRMVRGGVAPLKAGDVIGVGMSLLVLRA